MKKITLTVVASITLGSIAQAAPADIYNPGTAVMSSAMTAAPFIYSSYSTNRTLGKEIIEAQDDITYFVATDGKVRTAQLESALAWTKQNMDTANASDLEIAEELLAALGEK